MQFDSMLLPELFAAADSIPDHREFAEIAAIEAELAMVRDELRSTLEWIETKTQEVLDKYPLL